MIQHDEATQLAINVLALRQRRTDHLPTSLFGEGAWGLLLVMFIADAHGESLSALEACRRAGGAKAVTMRWLAVLEQEGLTASQIRSENHRLVMLSPIGVHAVEACMIDAQQLLKAQPHLAA